MENMFNSTFQNSSESTAQVVSETSEKETVSKTEKTKDTRTKVEKLKDELKAAKEREKKKREKYCLQLGRALDRIVKEDLDLAAFKERVKKQKNFIISDCAKNKNQDNQ